MSLLAWWQHRTFRERIILIGGLTTIFIVVVYLLLEASLQERNSLESSLPELRADLAWMQAHSDEMRELLQNNSRGLGNNMPDLSLSLVQSTLREVGLQDQVEELGGTTQSGISLNITGVAFSDLIHFIYLIQTRSQGRVETADIARSNEIQGIVSADIVFSEAWR